MTGNIAEESYFENEANTVLEKMLVLDLKHGALQ